MVTSSVWTDEWTNLVDGQPENILPLPTFTLSAGESIINRKLFKRLRVQIPGISSHLHSPGVRLHSTVTTPSLPVLMIYVFINSEIY